MFLTTHAIKRADERHIAQSEIEAVIEQPEISHPQARGRRLFRKGDLIVVLESSNGRVITVIRREAGYHSG